MRRLRSFLMTPGGWHERAAWPALAAVALVAAWWWLVAMARDMYGAMTGPSAWMMTSVWDAEHLVLLWTMWAVMMAAMMLPSAWPMLVTYGALARRQPATSGAWHVYAFASGYVFIWAVYSVGATVAQRLLTTAVLLSPMMEMTSRPAAAVLLAAAGVYQFTPLKRACLRACRSPLSFLMQRWRRGADGAFRMGAAYGAYCVGCCWGLMLLLFVGGVMNLYVIAALAAFVTLEKVVPGGTIVGHLGGVALIGLAAWLLLG